MFLLKESENRAKNNVPHVVVGLEPARVAEIPNRKGQNYILSIVTNLSVYQFRHTTVFARYIFTDLAGRLTKDSI